MTARWLLAIFASLLLAVAAFTFWPRAAVGAAEGMPVMGTLAPHLPALAGPWEEVGRIPAASIGRGPIVDLDERGDTLYVLQADRWFRIVGGIPSDPFGSKSPGSPAWLARGTAIRAASGGPVILDGSRQVVGHWADNGTRGPETELRRKDGGGTSTVEGLATDGSGVFHVSGRVTRADLSGQWVILRGRIGDARLDTVYRGTDTTREGDVHDMPRAVVGADGSLLVVPSLGWRMLTVAADGTVTDSSSRADGPRWAMPDSARRRYARILEQFPPEQRRAYALPATLPAIRGVTRDGNGRIIVLVSVSLDETHVEVLSAEGAPIGRPWLNPASEATFVANGSVFRIEDADGFTRIERQRILTPKD